MVRVRHIHDYRIRYSHAKKYRQKNVEMRVIIDRTEEPYNTKTEEDLNQIADKIWDIFVTETNFINFDAYAPEAISGTFETTETSEFEDDRFSVRLDYADYGDSLSQVRIKKAFDRVFSVIDANRLWEENRSEFWNRVRHNVRSIVNSELTGKPGRKSK